MAAIISFVSEDFPKEMRREILDRLPLKSCLILPRVSKLLLHEVDNDFFKAKCLDHFQTLKDLPRFLSPLVGCVDNPWAWIAYSLSGVRVNRELFPIAEKLALASQRNFLAFVAEQKGELMVTCDKFKRHLGVSSDKQKEIKTKLKEAERAIKAWHATSGPILEKMLEEVADVKDSYEELITKTMMKFREDLLKRGIHPADENLQFIDPEAILPELKKEKDDPKFEKYAKLRLEYNRLALDHKHLQLLKQCQKFLKVFPQIETKPQICSTALFYHILCLLPHMRNWMLSFSNALKLHEMLFETDFENPQILVEHASVSQNIMGMIDALPEPFPDTMRRDLVFQHGGEALDHLEDHLRAIKELFKKHCDTFFILRHYFFIQKQSDLNPMFNPIMRAAITGLEKKKALKLKFRYPIHDPNLEKVQERLKSATSDDAIAQCLLPAGPQQQEEKEGKVIDEKGWSSTDYSDSD